MKQYIMDSIEKTYGEKTLFKGLSLTVVENERIGLIGVNGTGKSSLLRVIAGIEGVDMGTIDHPNDYSIRYLSQQPELNERDTVLEAVFHSDAPVIRAVKEYEKVLIQYEKEPDNSALQQEYMKIQQKMDDLQAWDASTMAKTILSKLGIHRFDQFIHELSGGQQKRVALAQVLIETPDLLLLDEPTNHLDHEAIVWLEEFLSRYRGSVMVVSHDRYFLDQVSTRMIELDGGTAHSYKGNYQSFIEAKALREEQEQIANQKMKQLYRNELAWMRKGAKARTTKQKARIQRFEALDSAMPSSRGEDKLQVGMTGSRLGKQVIEADKVAKSFGSKTLFRDVSLLVQPGARIGIVGQNGAGKSTMLQILSQRLEPDSGSVTIGQTVKLAFFTQQATDLNENLRMIEYIREGAEQIELEDGSTVSATQMLERFLFPMSSHGTPIRKLSGGEKRRLYLLRLLMEKPNVLFLDEPTNDLDTETLTVLENYIEEFSGVVITVSHDRYFLDKTVDDLLVLNGDGTVDKSQLPYSEYLAQKEDSKKQRDKAAPSVQVKEKTPVKKMSYNEKREWEGIDEAIELAENRLASLEEELAAIGSDFEKAQLIMQEQEEVNEKLEHLIERWSYLSDLDEQS